ncbi:MAG TPA: hypothetical protein VGP47_07675 [Parachlamydiaceae bacterium]|nr:hypothetical protein [Parachlamydiaceae bacterium]
MSFKIKSLILLLTTVCFQAGAEMEMPSPIKDPAAIIGNEISRLDTLIEATELSLEGQKKLRVQIVEYQKLQDIYFKNPRDNELLFKVIKSAYRTLQTIKENHLAQTFDPDFIDELTVLAQPATKRGIPKP